MAEANGKQTQEEVEVIRDKAVTKLDDLWKKRILGHLARFYPTGGRHDDIFPRHEFDSLVKDYHRGQKFHSFSRWTQFMVMFIGQLSGRRSLGD